MALLSRLRLEAFGDSAAAVEWTLKRAARTIEETLDLEGCSGEQVIERDVGEPDGDFAYKGRLIYHPNVADDAKQRKHLDPSDEPSVRVTHAAGLDVQVSG